MEPMEIDVSTTFAAHHLKDIGDRLGYDDFSSVIQSGLDSLDFFALIQHLCREIKVLYELEECPTPIDSLGKDEVKAFLYELSAFLSELDCAYDVLVVGNLEERFATVSRRALLVQFLLSEMKSARLYAVSELQKPIEVADKPLTVTICKAMSAMKMKPPTSGDRVAEILPRINVESDRRLQACPTRPTPLFKAPMDEHKWAAVDQICHQMTQDCRARNLLLLKRIDVTVNSFLWSDRVRKREKEIMELFAARREDMAKVNPPDVARLLAASDDLLRVQQASCSRVRTNTRIRLQPSANAEKPKDRGGRPEEMYQPGRETFQQQRGGDRGHGGGRGRGGGGFRGRGGHGGPDHGGHGGGRGGHGVGAEQQARQEWQQRDEQRGGGGGGAGGGQQQRGGRGGGYRGAGGRGRGEWRGGNRGRPY